MSKENLDTLVIVGVRGYESASQPLTIAKNIPAVPRKLWCSHDFFEESFERYSSWAAAICMVILGLFHDVERICWGHATEVRFRERFRQEGIVV